MNVMLDFAYLAGTIAFFALMLGYVWFCARLGAAGAADTNGDTRP